MMGDLPMFNPAWADAIASIESGGRYGLLGPVTKNGERAHGKFQVMTGNIGPWTKEVLGRSLSPKEFLASPQAQDAVFQAKFGQYAQKYGPEGAAKAWFAGEKGMNNPNAKDMLGTSVEGYASKFSNALGGAPSPQMTAPASPIQAVELSPQGLLGSALQPQQQDQGLLPVTPRSPSPKRRGVDVSGLLALLQNSPPELRALLSQG